MLKDSILGSRLNVVGVVDKNVPRADKVLSIKRADESVGASYNSTRVFTSLDQAGSALSTQDTLPQ